MSLIILWQLSELSKKWIPASAGIHGAKQLIGKTACGIVLLSNLFHRKYQQQPFEDKESFRWVEVVHHSAPSLAKAQRVTVIAGRESDIYEVFADLSDAHTDLAIRLDDWTTRWLEGLSVAIASRLHHDEARAGAICDHVCWLATRPVSNRYERRLIHE